MLATEILGSAVARSWRSLLLVGVWRYGMLKLLRRRLRGSVRVVGVDDLALAEGMVLGIFGHGEDGKMPGRWRIAGAIYRTSMRRVKEYVGHVEVDVRWSASG